MSWIFCIPLCPVATYASMYLRELTLRLREQRENERDLMTMLKAGLGILVCQFGQLAESFNAEPRRSTRSRVSSSSSSSDSSDTVSIVSSRAASPCRVPTPPSGPRARVTIDPNLKEEASADSWNSAWQQVRPLGACDHVVINIDTQSVGSAKSHTD